jgi:hypothetical protein
MVYRGIRQNLRAIFDLHNQAVFEFSGVNTNGQAAWVFSYRIVKQNDPLWRLHTEDRVIAPPYIPKDFPSPSADLQTDNENISFADGTSFALPVAASIATRQQGEEFRRNVLQFRNCHKFRAETRMLLDAPASLSRSRCQRSHDSGRTAATVGGGQPNLRHPARGRGARGCGPACKLSRRRISMPSQERCAREWSHSKQRGRRIRRRSKPAPKSTLRNKRARLQPRKVSRHSR